jgi:hypothetical protein
MSVMAVVVVVKEKNAIGKRHWQLHLICVRHLGALRLHVLRHMALQRALQECLFLGVIHLALLG